MSAVCLSQDTEIKKDLAEAKTRFDKLCGRLDDGDRSIFAEVLEAQEWLELCQDANRYLLAVEHGEDCRCNSNGTEYLACWFCQMQNRYNEWKIKRG